MRQTGWVKDQFLNRGVNHFVVFSSLGRVMESSGDFEDEEKQQLAYTILQQTSTLLRSGESVKRLSMTFDDFVYIATTIAGEGENLGVVLKRNAADVLATT
ncbi:hypothetical protein TcCL_Unassigned07023 [Trypanosoma cruzi]|nr:hypothetical protein TcBrA4_0125760 [Trypanosoma cruzi]PBJ69019.1 hypothetical protein BCY84_20498 [Trypanosoma cruzi cruzi]RNC30460.1 hypothetical protein TcCL_Unassigned07023 [Trypanosoma cruzi]RNF23674.1 hypothetical protein TcG_01313 [Trypanosoma cruzi]